MANIITSIRIICGLALLFCPYPSGRFFALYLLGGLSDALDGFAARRLGTVSDFGSRLDTAADAVFFGAALFKLIRAVYFPPWLIFWILGIAFLKLSGVAAGLIIKRKLAAEHTPLNRVCGVLLFAVPLCVGRFPWQPVALLIILTCALATAAAVQELALILGKETPD